MLKQDQKDNIDLFIESLEKMMEMNIDELSDENKQAFEMKILGLRTIHQFLGALQQENYLKEYLKKITSKQ